MNKRERKITIFTAVLMAVMTLIIAWAIMPIRFETNDDTGILMFLTGAKTGHPTAETIFCNVLWGWLVSSLYSLNESIPWYTGIYMVLTLVVMTIVCYLCLELLQRTDTSNELNKKRLILGGGVFYALFFSVFCYYTVIFQFTTIAAMCGMGAILIMIMSNKECRYSYVLFAILLFFSDTIRPKIGYMTTTATVFIIFLTYFLYKVILKKYLAISIIIQVAVYSINALYEKINGWEYFRRYHSARAAWKDYAHVAYAENPGLYDSVGWSEKLLKLADKWFFMDKRITAENFEWLNADISKNSAISINNLALSVKRMFEIPQMKYALIIYGVITSIIFILFVLKRQYKAAGVIISGFAAMLVISVYFIMSGRFLYRGSYSVFIIFFVPTLFVGIKEIAAMQFDGKFINKSFIIYMLSILMIAIAGGSFISNLGLMNMTYKYAMDKSISESEITKSNVENYAINHINNIYIYDYSLAMSGSAFTSYSDGKPYNLTFWGGSGMYSPPYYDQLSANGRSELYAEDFFDDNIYFMSSTEPDSDLLDYMREEFGNQVNVKIVDEGTGFIVYKYIR